MEESLKAPSKISRKVSLFIALFFVMVLAVGGLSVYLARSISRSTDEVDLLSKHIEQTEAIHSTVHHSVFELSRAIMTASLDRLWHMDGLKEEVALRMADFLESHGRLPETSQEMVLFRRIQALVASLSLLSERVAGQVRKGAKVSLEEHQQLDTIAHRIPVLTKNLNDVHHSEVRDLLASNEQKINTIVYLYFAFLLGGLSLIALSNVYFFRSVAVPLKRLAAVTEDIAAGDFKRRVAVASSDEIGQLSRSFNLMAEKLETHEEMRKRFQEELERTVRQRTKELEEAHDHLVQLEKLKVTGEMYAGLTHEINNPLGIIVSRVKMLLDQGRQRQFPEKIIKELEMIDRNADRMARVIRNLLTFARKGEFELTPLNLNDAIEEIVGMVREPFAKMNIGVECNLEKNLPSINSSANQLQQVFLNLLTNARDALPEGGTINVRTYRDLEDKGRVVAELTDDGTGIPRGEIGRIFEPFFTTKEVGKGTGLGLSVSYGIMRAHAGDIRVESEPGKGSTFTLIFPSLAESKGEAA